MKEHSILFSSAMILALLDGRKKQTRRVVKRQPEEHHWQGLPGYVGEFRHEREDLWHFAHHIPQNPYWDCERTMRCPYGEVGDRLWVKETIRKTGEFDGISTSEYAADGMLTAADAWPWKRRTLAAIHCPRGLSRILLEITDVRVQRLHDISEDDAIAEGIETMPEHDRDARPTGRTRGLVHYTDGAASEFGHPVDAYQSLWESINGASSWDANPWIWAITFAVMQPVFQALEE